MACNNIYHITTKAEWLNAQAQGFYSAASLATEGFIHCAELQQVEGVLARYFKGQSGLLKLQIDVSKLVHPPIYEMAVSVNEAFPHVYGSINTNAVTTVTELGCV